MTVELKLQCRCGREWSEAPRKALRKEEHYYVTRCPSCKKVDLMKVLERRDDSEN